jgi:hypothetical protein
LYFRLMSQNSKDPKKEQLEQHHQELRSKCIIIL